MSLFCTKTFFSHAPARLRALCMLACLAGCGSPLAGQWQGTVDLGPADAWPIKLAFSPDGQSGQVSVAEQGHVWRTYTLCKVVRTGRQFEVEFDQARPDCGNGATRERRRLTGTVGEYTVFGEVLGDSSKLGFFRAYVAHPAD